MTDFQARSTGNTTGAARGDVFDGVADFAQDAKAKMADAAGNVSEAAKEQWEYVGEATSKAAGDATRKATSAINQQKAASADVLSSFAEAVNRAADAFDSDTPQVANYIRQGGEHLQGIAEVVRDKDIRELASEVRSFAERQPVVFFGGALLVGFAAVRFFKSAPAAVSDASSRADEIRHPSYAQQRS